MVIRTSAVGFGLCSLALGIALGGILSGTQIWVTVALILVVGLCVVVWKWGVRQAFLIIACLLLVLMGMLRISSMEPVRTEDADTSIGTQVVLVGTILLNALLWVGYLFRRFPPDGLHTKAEAYFWLLRSNVSD